MNDVPRQGYSLSGLFVLVTACAALVAGFTPLVRRAADGQVDGVALVACLIGGFFGGMFIGLLVGLMQFRVNLGAPLGAAAGAIIGLAAGLMSLLPSSFLGTSALTMLVGSGLVIGVSLINRRVNG
jgi:hypothetical protein